jgi:hypothetical protein
MVWEAMTLDEYAALQRATGAKVLKVQGTWWIEPRPFFFRPLFPFARITPQARNYPARSLLGGVLHLVPPETAANSRMQLFLYDDPGGYCLEQMAAKQRWVIKKASESFCARRITDLDHFVDQASGIYRSFYDRTGYFYKRERLNRERFAAWARSFFDQPKTVIMGAYHKERLSAVDISYRVEDVIIDDIFFSDTQSQSLRVTDFLVHTLRESARGTDVRFIFRGFPTGKQTLDDSKVNRGCRIVTFPAYCKINRMALYLGKAFMSESYRKLRAITSSPDADGAATSRGRPR